MGKYPPCEPDTPPPSHLLAGRRGGTAGPVKWKKLDPPLQLSTKDSRVPGAGVVGGDGFGIGGNVISIRIIHRCHAIRVCLIVKM